MICWRGQSTWNNKWSKSLTDLSPAAKAVLDAVEDDCIHPDDKHRIAAAALRAAADQVVIKLAGLGQESAWYLEEIATELEAQ